MLPMPLTVAERSLLSPAQVEAWSTLAWRAMLAEVDLSPKPGLVDRNNCGAHSDMALDDFHRSALAIRRWLPTFIAYGADSARLPPAKVLPGLRPIGMACEAQMFRATAGVNTHKGSIFSLGLLCAALGRRQQQQRPVTAESLCAGVAAICQGITERELLRNNHQATAGQRLFLQFGLTGARGEAQAGYPLVIGRALPHYRARLAEGRDPELALLDTLLLLLEHNGDTNVVSRGGLAGLQWLQGQAHKIRQQGGIRTAADLPTLEQFDRQCIARNLSPGGSADLLIITWFLAHLSSVHHHHNESRRVTHVANKR